MSKCEQCGEEFTPYGRQHKACVTHLTDEDVSKILGPECPVCQDYTMRCAVARWDSRPRR